LEWNQGLAFGQSQFLLAAQQAITFWLGNIGLVGALHQSGNLAVDGLVAQPQRYIGKVLRRGGLAPDFLKLRSGPDR
jgi:hypothetical protein